jgi:hypothetical protein
VFCLIAGGGGTVVQHHLFGTPYLLNRTAVWMLPCFLMMVVLEVDILVTGTAGVMRRISAAIAWSLVLAGGVHFARSANSRYALLQYHDADTKEMLRDLSQARDQGSPVDLEASWELIPAIEYYRVTKPLSWLGQVTVVTDAADAAYVSPKDLPLTGRLTERKRYPRTGNTLATIPKSNGPAP